MELLSLSITELRELEKQVEHAVIIRQSKDIESARNEIYAIAHRMGLPLKSVLAERVHVRTRKVAVKYRNPRNPTEEWTGRGRQPKWVEQLIAAGGSIESTRV